MRAFLKGITPVLPMAIWAMIGAQLLASIGTGFVLPFGTIYLHFVRGIAIPVVGAVVSTISLGGLVVTAAGAGFIDRLGARRLVLAGSGLQAAGFVVFAFAVNIPLAFAAALLVGAGNGVVYPAVSTVVAELTTPRQRSGAASLTYIAINVGIGLGSVVGGFVVSVQHPLTFVAVYLANAASFVAFALVIALRVPAASRRGEGGRQPAPGALRLGGGYREVLGDRRFLALVGFNAVAVLVGYSQIDSAMPLYAKTYLGVQPSALGLILAANTAFIVIAQLPVTRSVRRWPRTRTLALFSATWSLAWLIGLAASSQHSVPAAVLLGVFAVVFGLGECLLSSTFGPLAMDMARPARLGAYMAATSLSWSVGLLIGPSIGSVIVGSGLHQILWPLFAACCLGLAGWALALERAIPPGVNRSPVGVAEDPV